MRHGGLLFVAFVSIGAAWAGSASAQPPGMPPPPGGSASPLMIAMAPAVQEELKLTAEQKTKIFNVFQEMSQKQRDLMQSVIFGGGTTPQAVFQARHELRREMEHSLGQVFDKKQNQRFLQIVLRAEGPLAVARPEMGSRLGLSDEQSNQVQTIAIQLQQAQFRLFVGMRMNGVAAGGPGFNRDAVNQYAAESNKLRKEAVQRIGRVLKAKQRDDFDKMLGEPFDLGKLQSSDSSAPAETAKTDTGKETDKDTASSAASDDDPRPEEKPKTAAKKKARKGR